MIKNICVQLKHKEMEMRINDFHQMFYQFGTCVWQWVDLFPLNVCVCGYVSVRNHFRYGLHIKDKFCKTGTDDSDKNCPGIHS